jgi:hypothetical protein
MANGVRKVLVSGGATILMVASTTLGLQGSAAASSPRAASETAAVSVIVDQAGLTESRQRCRTVWHRGYWQWVPRRYWDGGHQRWTDRGWGNQRNRWVKVWHRAESTRVCR